MRVGMISGRTTKRASDGIVKMMLATTVVNRRNAVVRWTRAPRGTAIRRPSTNGTNDSHRWISVRSQASPRCVKR
jgi:hypothetical protein